MRKTKKCSRCKEIKSVIDFYISHRNKDGYGYRCKNCHKIMSENKKEYRKEYYQLNKDKKQAQSKDWKRKNSVKIAKEKREERKMLPDHYVRQLLTTVLKLKDIPKKLIQGKRQHLQIKQFIRENDEKR